MQLQTILNCVEPHKSFVYGDAWERKKLQLLEQLAEFEVEQHRRRGLHEKVPQFSEIEDDGQKLGRLFNRHTQSRLANEVVAGERKIRNCPTRG